MSLSLRLAQRIVVAELADDKKGNATFLREGIHLHSSESGQAFANVLSSLLIMCIRKRAKGCGCHFWGEITLRHHEHLVTDHEFAHSGRS